MAPRFALLLALPLEVAAFPWVANVPGVDRSLIDKRTQTHKRADSCPFNSNHPGAAPYNSDFPYTGAKNGLPGTQKGGIKVPADGDTAHAFTAPGPNDIRGPCPGLNTAANHNFLSHDGITNFNELVDAQQNLYNVGYDLAVFLATIAIAEDGDVVTQKLSIGCDATSRTSATGVLLGSQTGLNGHNKFEGDTSLTRNDFFLANGDDFSFNGTLFGMMQDTCKGNFNRENLALYRKQRYDQSRRDNPNFVYELKALLLYGAASFLYELFPNLGPQGNPDLPTISSFFGAVDNGNGQYSHKPEQIPDDWHNRVAPYTLLDVAAEILAQYLMYPVEFGGNIGKGNFNGIGTITGLKDGKIPNATTAAQAECLLYQLATANVPSAISNVPILGSLALDWLLGKLNPVFKNTGCPLRIS